MDRAIDMATVISFNCNSTRSVLVTKPETSNGQKSAIQEYKVDMGSNGKVLPVDMLKNYSPKQQWQN